MFVALLLLIAFRSIGATSAPEFLGHTERITLANFAAPCSTIVIPPNICNNCRINPYDSEGDFESPQQVFDLSKKRCLAGIRSYIRQNPCDNIRAQQFRDINLRSNSVRLGIFMYSMCELCCDCVPIGARAGEYSQRSSRGISKLTHVRRGNCAAHGFYDVCKVLPNIRSSRAPGENAPRGWEPICPILRRWIDSDNSAMWWRNNDARMDSRIVRFLEKFTRDAGCFRKDIWKQCARMEAIQGRI